VCRLGFNPRAPRGARRKVAALGEGLFEFQSTRPARGATSATRLRGRPWPVTIHAPRAGRDAAETTCLSASASFNPRAPRGARQMLGYSDPRPIKVSIHAPRAGRDLGSFMGRGLLGCFNPRAPRGARHARNPEGWRRRHVSIHAPRAGRDLGSFMGRGLLGCFNPRAPRGARLERASHGRKVRGFNPRAPRGARHLPIFNHIVPQMFQSTRPARGATALLLRRGGREGVSIHAPRAGRDWITILAFG